jgi:hypothetical protein
MAVETRAHNQCLDPLNELESCGGCLFPGPVDPNYPVLNATTGIE